MSSKAGYTALQPSGGNKVDQINSELEDIKDLVGTNIDLLTQRGDKLNDVSTKTEILGANAKIFKKSAGDVKNKMWWQEIKMKFILAGVSTLIILIVILIILGQLGVFHINWNVGGSTTAAPAPSSTAGASKLASFVPNANANGQA
ncbi:Vesicle-associated membrane protein [Nowakowskiella sp. JEL0078]|nr:Vesicle-associated membrane protein [Nowakowskiella sp. JEL0078]